MEIELLSEVAWHRGYGVAPPPDCRDYPSRLDIYQLAIDFQVPPTAFDEMEPADLKQFRAYYQKYLAGRHDWRVDNTTK